MKENIGSQVDTTDLKVSMTSKFLSSSLALKFHVANDHSRANLYANENAMRWEKSFDIRYAMLLRDLLNAMA